MADNQVPTMDQPLSTSLPPQMIYSMGRESGVDQGAVPAKGNGHLISSRLSRKSSQRVLLSFP